MKTYSTKQRSTILSLFESNPEKSFTADEVCGMLTAEDTSVNRSTVYRNLDAFVRCGSLKKEPSVEDSRNRYKYNATAHCSGHLHLACSSCNEIIHLDEEQSEALAKALKADCGFLLDNDSTVITGVCEKCAGKMRK